MGDPVHRANAPGQGADKAKHAPNRTIPGGSSHSVQGIGRDRWVAAENRVATLLECIMPTLGTDARRSAVVSYVQRLILSCFDCQVAMFGSVPLKTYLPDGDIDLTALSWDHSLKDVWASEVKAILEAEGRNPNAEFRVVEVQYIQAEVKLIKCLVDGIVVDISFNQLGGLCTLCFLEEVDRKVGNGHLFKRSIILVKAWCYYESRILGAPHGLISTYGLETLVLYIFHVFYRSKSLDGPLQVLHRFLEFFSTFNWDSQGISLRGPVLLSALPHATPLPPAAEEGDLLLSDAFIRQCTTKYGVAPASLGGAKRPFPPKHMNIVDPLLESNNLGRSISKGNFYRIRSAFAYGARKLSALMRGPEHRLLGELDHFFRDTWTRHRSGTHPFAAARAALLPRPGPQGFAGPSSHPAGLAQGAAAPRPVAVANGLAVSESSVPRDWPELKVAPPAVCKLLLGVDALETGAQPPLPGAWASGPTSPAVPAAPAAPSGSVPGGRVAGRLVATDDGQAGCSGRSAAGNQGDATPVAGGLGGDLERHQSTSSSAHGGRPAQQHVERRAPVLPASHHPLRGILGTNVDAGAPNEDEAAAASSVAVDLRSRPPGLAPPPADRAAQTLPQEPQEKAHKRMGPLSASRSSGAVWPATAAGKGRKQVGSSGPENGEGSLPTSRAADVVEDGARGPALAPPKKAEQGSREPYDDGRWRGGSDGDVPVVAPQVAPPAPGAGQGEAAASPGGVAAAAAAAAATSCPAVPPEAHNPLLALDQVPPGSMEGFPRVASPPEPMYPSTTMSSHTPAIASVSSPAPPRPAVPAGGTHSTAPRADSSAHPPQLYVDGLTRGHSAPLQHLQALRTEAGPLPSFRSTPLLTVLLASRSGEAGAAGSPSAARVDQQLYLQQLLQQLHLQQQQLEQSGHAGQQPTYRQHYHQQQQQYQFLLRQQLHLQLQYQQQQQQQQQLWHAQQEQHWQVPPQPHARPQYVRGSYLAAAPPIHGVGQSARTQAKMWSPVQEGGGDSVHQRQSGGLPESARPSSAPGSPSVRCTGEVKAERANGIVHPPPPAALAPRGAPAAAGLLKERGADGEGQRVPPAAAQEGAVVGGAGAAGEQQRAGEGSVMAPPSAAGASAAGHKGAGLGPSLPLVAAHLPPPAIPVPPYSAAPADTGSVGTRWPLDAAFLQQQQQLAASGPPAVQGKLWAAAGPPQAPVTPLPTPVPYLVPVSLPASPPLAGAAARGAPPVSADAAQARFPYPSGQRSPALPVSPPNGVLYGPQPPPLHLYGGAPLPASYVLGLERAPAGVPLANGFIAAAQGLSAAAAARLEELQRGGSGPRVPSSPSAPAFERPASSSRQPFHAAAATPASNEGGEDPLQPPSAAVGSHERGADLLAGDMPLLLKHLAFGRMCQAGLGEPHRWQPPPVELSLEARHPQRQAPAHHSQRLRLWEPLGGPLAPAGHPGSGGSSPRELGGPHPLSAAPGGNMLPPGAPGASPYGVFLAAKGGAAAGFPGGSSRVAAHEAAARSRQLSVLRAEILVRERRQGGAAVASGLERPLPRLQRSVSLPCSRERARYDGVVWEVTGSRGPLPAAVRGGAMPHSQQQPQQPQQQPPQQRAGGRSGFFSAPVPHAVLQLQQLQPLGPLPRHSPDLEAWGGSESASVSSPPQQQRQPAQAALLDSAYGSPAKGTVPQAGLCETGSRADGLENVELSRSPGPVAGSLERHQGGMGGSSPAQKGGANGVERAADQSCGPHLGERLPGGEQGQDEGTATIGVPHGAEWWQEPGIHRGGFLQEEAVPQWGPYHGARGSATQFGGPTQAAGTVQLGSVESPWQAGGGTQVTFPGVSVLVASMPRGPTAPGWGYQAGNDPSREHFDHASAGALEVHPADAARGRDNWPGHWGGESTYKYDDRWRRRSLQDEAAGWRYAGRHPTGAAGRGRFYGEGQKSASGAASSSPWGSSQDGKDHGRTSRANEAWRQGGAVNGDGWSGQRGAQPGGRRGDAFGPGERVEVGGHGLGQEVAAPRRWERAWEEGGADEGLERSGGPSRKRYPQPECGPARNGLLAPSLGSMDLAVPADGAPPFPPAAFEHPPDKPPRPQKDGLTYELNEEDFPPLSLESPGRQSTRGP